MTAAVRAERQRAIAADQSALQSNRRAARAENVRLRTYSADAEALIDPSSRPWLNTLSALLGTGFALTPAQPPAQPVRLR